MKSKIVISLLSLLCVFNLNAQTLRFGLLPAESAIPIILAQEEGFFAQENLKVELSNFPSPLDRNVVLQAGKLDGAIADIMSVLAFKEAGFKVQAASDINEDFKIIASPKSGITSIKQLDGKDVSLIPKLALEYIMDKIAEKNGISYKIVMIPSIPARFEALLANRLSAVVFTEPQATILAAQGAKILTGSKDYNLQAGCLLFTEDFMSKNPEAVKAFYRAYNKAVDFINSTPASTYGEILTKYGFPDAVSQYLGSGVRYHKAGPISADSYASLLDWSLAKGIATKKWTQTEICTTQFLP